MTNNVATMARTMLTWDIGPDSDTDVMALITEHFPTATVWEIGEAVKAVMHELRERAQQEERQLKGMQVLQALAERVPDSEAVTLGDKLRILAARGDAQAQAVLDHWASYASRVRLALFEAAADRHPDYRRAADGVGWEYIGKGELPEYESPMSRLIDWFQATYPHEARAVEDAVPEW
jgi:hypothetical protein